MWILVFQRMALEFVLDILFFPVWWYTKGTRHALLFAIELFKNGNSHLAPGLWLRNIFVPMFGQYDFQGRLVSFFMRFMNVILRSFVLAFWFLAVTVVFLLWLMFPLVVGYMFFISLVSGVY